ncbi:MAG: polysaccharide deacetylase family protein, partial [Deltaproteobacteria bacterium]|nr:polysaccharide deacetylase family protein [Deltaproteobacteria bacterium]
AIICFALYFSGIFWIYQLFRKRILKRFRTVILMYHRIRDDGKDAEISVSTKNFRKQMDYLRKNFTVISLDILMKNIGNRVDTPVDHVAITFDDGFKDNYLNAYPILREYKFPATIFLISQLIDKKEDMLDRDAIKAMKNDTISFGSHTATHRILSEIPVESATTEIIDSKVELETMLNEDIQFLAYPKGKRKHFNTEIKQLIKKSGYKAALCSENGEIHSNSDLFELKRIGMRNYPLFVFRVRLSGLFETKVAYWIRNLFGLT